MLTDIGKTLGGLFGKNNSLPVLQNRGRCPTCVSDVTFTAMEPYLRDHYFCSNCRSIPRERALMAVIEMYYPHWRELTVHESSPSSRGASLRLAQESASYIGSQYFPDKQPGSMVGAFRCENLEALTFADASIDLHVTQDVIEHVFQPTQVFREIARTLKPGGAHIFTVPLVSRQEPSKVRAQLSADGKVIHVQPPVYHGNPISEEGSLVVVDWGHDICRHIFRACGLLTYLVHFEDLGRGIKADLNEVLVTLKPANDLNDIP